MRRRTLLAGALCAALLWTACGWIPHQRLAERVLSAPSRVYGRPLVLTPGMRLGPKCDFPVAASRQVKVPVLPL